MSQRQVVLQALKDAGDRGVHSFEFLQLGLPRAAARVHELRDQGHTITAVRERLHGTAEGVRYRLMETDAVPECFVPRHDDDPGRLFDPPPPATATPHWRSDAA